jgi:DNA-binding PadR family transcriptional regulator
MENSSRFAPPLSQPVFYVLLALLREESHGYGILSAMADASLGQVKMPAGTLYPLLKRLIEARLVEATGFKATYNSDTPRKHYALTEHGRILLKGELRRMRHAVEIGQKKGLFNDELPLDLQKLLADFKAQG